MKITDKKYVFTASESSFIVSLLEDYMKEKSSKYDTRINHFIRCLNEDNRILKSDFDEIQVILSDLTRKGIKKSSSSLKNLTVSEVEEKTHNGINEILQIILSSKSKKNIIERKEGRNEKEHCIWR